MANKIAPNVVVGHSFISTKRTELTLEEIYQYCEIADELLEPKYFVYSYKICIDYFSKNYSCFFTQEKDTLKVNCDISLLIRYFRLGLPKDLVKILDEAGEKFNSINSDKLQNFSVNKEDKNKNLELEKEFKKRIKKK